MRDHLSIMQIEVNFLNEKEEGTGYTILHINQISRREIVGSPD